MAFRMAVVAVVAAQVSALKISVPESATIFPDGEQLYTLVYDEVATPNSLVFDVMPIPASLAVPGLEFTVTNMNTTKVQFATSLSVFIQNTQYVPGSHFQLSVKLAASSPSPVNYMVNAYEAGSDVDPPSFTATDAVSHLPDTSFRGEIYIMLGSLASRTTSGWNVQVPKGPDEGVLVTITPGSFPSGDIPKIGALSGPDLSKVKRVFLTKNPTNFTFTVMETSDIIVDWKASPPVAGTVCPFRDTSGAPDMLACKNGIECNGTADPSCCKDKDGIKMCMEGYQMCNREGACDGDYCCSQDCLDIGQYPRTCGVSVKMDFTAVSFTPSPSGSNDDSLTGGGVFLVLFFSLGATYCIFGVAFKYTNGARGCPELMPNHTWWMELPKLMSEGLDFLKAKILGGQTGYAVYSDKYAPAPFDPAEQSGGLSQAAQNQAGYGTAENL